MKAIELPNSQCGNTLIGMTEVKRFFGIRRKNVRNLQHHQIPIKENLLSSLFMKRQTSKIYVSAQFQSFFPLLSKNLSSFSSVPHSCIRNYMKQIRRNLKNTELQKCLILVNGSFSFQLFSYSDFPFEILSIFGILKNVLMKYCLREKTKHDAEKTDNYYRLRIDLLPNMLRKNESYLSKLDQKLNFCKYFV